MSLSENTVINNSKEKSSIIFKVDTEMKWLLKDAANKSRTTMQDYILTAINDKLKKDGVI